MNSVEIHRFVRVSAQLEQRPAAVLHHGWPLSTDD
jgi:hypothetical protein